MKMKNLKIGSQLNIGFGLMAFLTLFIGLMAITQMQVLANLTEQMYRHPFVVSNEVRDIRANIIAMHRSMKDIALSRDIEQIEDAAAVVDAYEQEVYHSFDTVFEQFLGDPGDVEAAYEAFTAWKAIRDEVIQLMEMGERERAADITKGKGAEHVDHLNTKIQIMVDFANAKGNSFFEETQAERANAILTMIVLLTATIIIGVVVTLTTTHNIATPLSLIASKIEGIAQGHLNQTVNIYRGDEIGELANSFREMQLNLQHKADIATGIAAGDLERKVEAKDKDDQVALSINKIVDNFRIVTAENEKQSWLKTGQNELNERMRGNLDISTFTQNIITYLAKYLNAQVGALYLVDEESRYLELYGRYALVDHENLQPKIKIGQGLVGQAALEQKTISITDVPQGYMRISSAIGEAVPQNVLVLPIAFNGNLSGAIELGSFKEFSAAQLEFTTMVMENIAIGLSSTQSRWKMKVLLEETQQQAEELQAQRKELSAFNEALEKQTKKLAQKNRDLEVVQYNLEQKAKELELANQYKSEFLANMSHELRTPLNSILVLSRDFTANKEGALSKDQIEAARIIHNSGVDLLGLINQVLDLSRIEVGKMTINIEGIRLKDIADSIETTFKHLAADKGLKLSITIAQNLPETLQTDPQRLKQIIRNLVSNALKFTEKGEITIEFCRPAAETILHHNNLDIRKALAISVTDTGIGIAEDKQAVIFDAFQQIDSSTARKYEGTGLGLSISRELTRLLGGEIQLTSIEGQGSTFTVYIPQLPGKDSLPSEAKVVGNQGTVAPLLVRPKTSSTFAEQAKFTTLADENEAVFAGKCILIVDDDMRNAFAISKILEDSGTEVYKAANGKDALDMVAKVADIDLILMDIMMPVMDGYEAIRQIRLQKQFQNLPIIALAAKDAVEEREKCILAGANGYLSKPVDIDSLLSLIVELWLNL